LANPIKLVTKPAIHGLGDLTTSLGLGGWGLLILALLLTFLGLISLVKILRNLMVTRLENLFDRVIFGSAFRGLVFGILLTVIVQSSSVTTSLAVPLVGAGILTVRQILPYTMGANIGTTMTALLASLAAYAAANHMDPSSVERATLGVHVAFHHVLFNVIGVALLWNLRWLPEKVARAFARLATWNRLVPLAYIILVFYLGPLLVILLGR
jgi:sodium-dependent phosphate cotransporter